MPPPAPLWGSGNGGHEGKGLVHWGAELRGEKLVLCAMWSMERESGDDHGLVTLLRFVGLAH